MPDNLQISKKDAIRQVIAEGIAMDYVDVVENVRKKYGLSVSAVLVEKLHHQMRKEQMGKKTKHGIPPRIDVESKTNIAGNQKQVATHPPADDLVHALHYVKAVNGLKNAKRALAELEVLMQESND